MNYFSYNLSRLIKIFAITLTSLSLVSCSQNSTQEVKPTSEKLDTYRTQLSSTLSNPVDRAALIAKILGSTSEEERHAYMKFHVFGFAGDGNVVPFFSMNNYIVQKWAPDGDGNFEVWHYEVAYYSKFDEQTPIETWENPLTGEMVDVPPFILGPVYRLYGPDGSDSRASFASDPLNITMIGDRIYVPTLSSFAFPNQLKPEDWGPYSNGPVTFWDSMLTYSADVRDVFDDEKTHVDATIQMQNLVSWAPFLKLGQHPGRTMVRAYGQHISGYDDLPDDIRKNLEKYTPEIFDIESWEDTRMDTIELAKSLMEKRANGTLDIDQEGYKPFEVVMPGSSDN